MIFDHHNLVLDDIYKKKSMKQYVLYTISGRIYEKQKGIGPSHCENLKICKNIFKVEDIF